MTILKVIIEVPVKINDFNLLLTCRVVEKEDPFYDILINLKTQMDHNLFIHPMLYSLCQFTPFGLIDVIAPINNDNIDEEKLVCLIKAVPNAPNLLKSIEGLSQENIFIMKFFKTL